MNVLREIREGLVIAFAALRANILRATLTTLGVVIGIMAVTLMGWLVEGLNMAFLDSISSLGRDVIYVDRSDWSGGEDWSKYRNRKRITAEDGDALRGQLTTARAVVPTVDSWNTTVDAGDKTMTGLTLVASTYEYPVVSGITVDEGRFFSQLESDAGRDVAVIGCTLAEQLFPHEYPEGKGIRVDKHDYTVLGVMAKQGSFLGMFSLDDRLIVPFKSYQRHFGSQQSVVLAVKAIDPDDVDNTKYEVIGAMRKVRNLRPGMPEDFALNQQQQFEQQTATLRSTIYIVGLAIGGLALLVGGIGIMNIMFVSVTERTKEIGIRKALGAPQRMILFQFLVESAVLCLLGGMIGLALASAVPPIVKYGFDVTFLPVVVPAVTVFIAVSVSVLVGLTAGFIPAFRASRLDPVDALRSE